MHLLWFLVLLILGPSSACLSLDALRSRRPWFRAQSSRAAGVSLFFARILLGLVYFFPGVEKLRVSGFDWALSDNLANQMRLKWFMAGGQVPALRIDLYPTWLHALGLATLAFECSFVLLVCLRRGRLLAALMGAGFHAGAQYFMYIPFPSLWVCYVMLWDGPTKPRALRLTSEPTPLAPLLAGAGLCAVVALQGVRGATQAWPFACYPSFAQAVAPTISDLAIVLDYPDATRHVLRPPRLRPSQEWGAVWRMLGLYDGKVIPRALDAYAAVLIRASGLPEPPPGSTLRYYSEVFSTEPGRWEAGGLRHDLRYSSRISASQQERN